MSTYKANCILVFFLKFYVSKIQLVLQTGEIVQSVSIGIPDAHWKTTQGYLLSSRPVRKLAPEECYLRLSSGLYMNTSMYIPTLNLIHTPIKSLCL